MFKIIAASKKRWGYTEMDDHKVALTILAWFYGE